MKSILKRNRVLAVIALIGKSIRANDNTEANRCLLYTSDAADE